MEMTGNTLIKIMEINQFIFFINLITTIMAKQVKKEKPQTGGGDEIITENVLNLIM